MCKHENHMLIGMADGIRCRGCGAFFSVEELKKAPRRNRRKKEDPSSGKEGGKGDA